MRTLACLTAAGMLALSATGARAETIAYGEAFDTLYRFGLDSHVAVEVGPAGFFGGQLIGNISGLSFSNDEELFAVAGGLNALTRINPAERQRQPSSEPSALPARAIRSATTRSIST